MGLSLQSLDLLFSFFQWKDGVRIGVAQVDPSFLIALPGPHEEVKIGIEVIIEGLKKGLTKEEFAASLSEKYIQLLKSIHQKGVGP